MNTLEIILIIVSALLATAILLQQRAGGLGSAFGSDSSVYASRRGAEKLLYNLTILLILVFLVLIIWILTTE